MKPMAAGDREASRSEGVWPPRGPAMPCTGSLSLDLRLLTSPKTRLDSARGRGAVVSIRSLCWAWFVLSEGWSLLFQESNQLISQMTPSSFGRDHQQDGGLSTSPALRRLYGSPGTAR